MATQRGANTKDPTWRVKRVIPAGAPAEGVTRPAEPVTTPPQKVEAPKPKTEKPVQPAKPVHPTTSASEAQRQIDALRHQVQQLSAQIARRNSNGPRAQDQPTLQTLAQAVHKLLQDANRPSDDQLSVIASQRYHAERRKKEEAEVARHLEWDARMAAARQETTECCSCGEHRGIRFIETVERLNTDGSLDIIQDIILADNVCPMRWWFTLSKLAFNKGELSAFTAQNPFSQYIVSYSLP